MSFLLLKAGRALNGSQPGPPSGPSEGEILAANNQGLMYFMIAQSQNAEQLAAALSSGMVFM